MHSSIFVDKIGVIVITSKVDYAICDDMEKIILDFSNEMDSLHWSIVDDVVMGGQSIGKFELDHRGQGVFFGAVSTANNGGFSMVRFPLNHISVHGFSQLVLRVKGDGKKYQTRIKENSAASHSYIAYFETTTNWETIRIPLKEMYPSFRGRKLKMPNFNGQTIEEVGILIGNKNDENFHLQIDKIGLE